MKKKSILFINPSGNHPPFGVLYLIAHLQSKGFRTFLFDRNAENKKGRPAKDIDRDMLAFIANRSPDFIGLTMMTCHFFEIAAVVKTLRDAGIEIPIIAGGVHPTFEPIRTIRHIPGVDIAVMGAGEYILEMIMNGQAFDTIPSIAWNENGEIRQNTFQNMWRKEELHAAYSELDPDVYFAKNEVIFNGLDVTDIMMVMSSNSCPFSCSFCVNGRMQRTAFFHSDEFVLAEMRELMEKFHRKAFFFVDSIFRGSRTRAQTFMQAKINSDLRNVPWAAPLRAEYITPEIAELLKQSNCIQVYIGVESGSQKILNYYNKHITVEQNKKAIEILNNHHITVIAPFIYGAPPETEEDLENNIQFFREVELFDSAVQLLLPNPGSAIYAELVDKGILHPDDFSTYDRIGTLSSDLRPDRNYTNIPFDRFKKIYQNHAVEIYESCKENRKYLSRRFGIDALFNDSASKASAGDKIRQLMPIIGD